MMQDSITVCVLCLTVQLRFDIREGMDRKEEVAIKSPWWSPADAANKCASYSVSPNRSMDAVRRTKESSSFPTNCDKLRR